MNKILNITQIVIAVGLTGSILLQSQGGGLGQAFGGGGSSYRKRRGAERVLFIATIVLACLFIISSIARLIFF